MKRFVILFILGMIAEGKLLLFSLSSLHIFCNTLQAIAVGYVVAALAIMHLKKFWQGVLCAALMIGYWALMNFVPFPGHAAGTVLPNANLALYLDKTIMGHFQDGLTYTWILTSMTFSATVLLGMMAGHVLKSGMPQRTKLFSLIAAGAGCVAAGLIASHWDPIIKHIWTSSFTLFSGGLCFLMVALFYLVIDVIGLKRWAFFFIVIGSNSIFIYMLSEVSVGYLTPSQVKALLAMPPVLMGALLAFLFAVQWMILYTMYKNKIFIKV